MAFKATRPARTPAKKTAAAISADETRVPFVEEREDTGEVREHMGVAGEAVLSVDDLIGAPKQKELGMKNNEVGESQSRASSPQQSTNTSNASGVRSEESRSERRFERPAGYGPPAGRQAGRPGGGFSSSGGPALGWHRDYPHRGGGSFRRDVGPSRFGDMNRSGFRPRNGDEGNGFTQDVNVPTETVRGVLDTMPEGHGFLRPKYTPSDSDIYISQSQIRRFLLRNGDMVEGQARPPKENERYWGLLKVEKINEHPAESMERRPNFEDLVPIYPNKQLKLETGDHPLSTRIIDLVAPIGFGQRGLIVSPPKAGKTTILKELAAGITANYPEVHLMAALIGERPEEVTDISRSVKGEVFASNFDESPSEQTRIAEVALDRAKRLVEMGKDVVILLDSITRLARAYNLVVNPSGRTLSGGFDPAALYPAKRFLGAARCVEGVKLAIGSSKLDKDVGSLIVESQVSNVQPQSQTSNVQLPTSSSSGGSLTVIGTALVETGSRMDDLIYEEFKGTGNMELHLARSLQERRIFPAIDLVRSGTRHDELLLGEDMMKKILTLRHMLSLLGDEERTMMLIERLGKTKDNLEFLDSLGKG